MERTVIEIDCLLCDSCNDQLSDENFIALDNCTWYEGNLWCGNCSHKYGKNMPVIMHIVKGDDLSKTDLALPIVMEFG
jgi:hypothetical protein